MRDRYRSACCVALILAGGLSSAAAYADPIAPFATERNSAQQYLLGHQLETRFQSFMKSCSNVQMPLKMTKPGRVYGATESAVSSIDYDIIDGLKLNVFDHAIYAPKGNDIGVIFGYVYGTAEKAELKNTSSRAMHLSSEDQGKLLDSGFPSIRYEASCGSVIEGALRINSEYSFPVATVKGALNADYKSDRRSSLGVVYGRFRSPIWDMWAITDVNKRRPGDRFFASMLIWDWYLSNAPGDYWLLTYFDGSFFYRKTSNNRVGGASVSAKSDISMPIVTASASGSVNITNQTKFDLSDFAVFVDLTGETPTTDFQPLPSVGDVVLVAEQNAVVSAPSYDGDQLVESGQAKSFSMNISSLPAVFCQKSQWKVLDDRNASAASNTISVSEMGEVVADGAATCRLRLSYAPGAISQGADIAMSPYLASNAGIAGKWVLIPLGQVRFSTTLHPSLSVTRQDPLEVSAVPGGSGSYNLVWKLDLKLIDDGKYSDINRIDVNEVTIACPANTFTAGEPAFSASFVGVAGATSRTVRMIGSAQFNGALDPSKISTVNCALTGNVVFTPSAGGPVIRRPVPALQLGYPVLH